MEILLNLKWFDLNTRLIHIPKQIKKFVCQRRVFKVLKFGYFEFGLAGKFVGRKKNKY